MSFSDTSHITCFTYLWILPSRRAFCCRQLRAASGIALLPLPGWASLRLLSALSTLSSLRQAKINWADSEVGAVSRFTRFTREIWIAWGFSSQHISLNKLGFHKKPLHQWPPLLYKSPFKPCFPHIGHYVYFWLWRRCCPRVSPKPSILLSVVLHLLSLA